MVYPTYTHVIKALDVQPTVPKFTTQRQVRRFRKFLMAVVARIMAPDSQALIDSVLFKYRIEMRCTYQGTGAQLREMLSAYRAPTLIDLEAISGVRVQLALVSKHSYFDNLRRLNTILEDAAWLIGRGNLASAVPDVVVARVHDAVNIVGLTPGLFKAIPLACKKVTWHNRSPNDLPTKQDVADSKYLWEEGDDDPNPAQNGKRSRKVLQLSSAPRRRRQGPEVDERARELQHIAHLRENIVLRNGRFKNKFYASNLKGGIAMAESTFEKLIARVWSTFGINWPESILSKETMAKHKVDRQERAYVKRLDKRRRCGRSDDSDDDAAADGDADGDAANDANDDNDANDEDDNDDANDDDDNDDDNDDDDDDDGDDDEAGASSSASQGTE
jgi:hypothetical protein